MARSSRQHGAPVHERVQRPWIAAYGAQQAIECSSFLRVSHPEAV